MPSLPCTCSARVTGRLNGVAQPSKTGGGDGTAAASKIRRTFDVQRETETFPATTVIALTSSLDDLSAKIRARASSRPGSVSMTAGAGDAMINGRPQGRPCATDRAVRLCNLRAARPTSLSQAGGGRGIRLRLFLDDGHVRRARGSRFGTPLLEGNRSASLEGRRRSHCSVQDPSGSSREITSRQNASPPYAER